MADPLDHPVSGWIILDKPRGLGSTQAVAAVKRNLREGGYAKTKVGHGGTLDPLAEGVLPIALGEATKLAGRMLDASKIYEFTIQFGEETETLDTEGAVIERSDRSDNGAIVVALVDNEEATLKYIRKKGDTVALEPANKDYETRIFAADRVRVQGRLVGLLRTY